MMPQPIDGTALDVLRQLFLNGPTYDGNITSKSGRNVLFMLGLAETQDGFAYLNFWGVQYALSSGMGRLKE